MQKIKHTPLFGAVFGLCLLLFIFAVTAIGASASEQNQSNSVYPVRRDARAVTTHNHPQSVAETALTAAYLQQNGYTLSAKSYYLEDDLKISSPLVMPASGTVTICLNGHILQKTGTSGSVIKMPTTHSGVTLTINDCNPETDHTNRTDLPENIYNITGGLITGGHATNGGGIDLNSNSSSSIKLTLNGGTIAGNTATENGGGINEKSSGSVQLYINGTTICDNTAKNGGGIYIGSGGSPKSISSGRIINNTASSSGGGICFSTTQASLSISNTEIAQNKALGNLGGNGGGGIYSFSLIKMSGGSIHDNYATNTGGGILSTTNPYGNSGNVKENIAQISGSYSQTDPIIIQNNTAGDSAVPNNIFISYINNGTASAPRYSHQALDLPSSSLNNNSYIGITIKTTPEEEDQLEGGTSVPIPISSAATSDDVDYDTYASYFHADNPNDSITYDSVTKKLYYNINHTDIPEAPSHKHNVSVKCETTGENLPEFKALTSAMTKNPLADGHYYLTQDMDLTAPLTLNPNATEVTLCLNGHVLKQTAAGFPVIEIANPSQAAVFNLCDCQPNTAHTGLADDLQGITGGLITGGTNKGISITNAAQDTAPGVTFNMYGGAVAGNTGDYGGGIHIGERNHTFNLYNGQISHNTSSNNGGGVYVSGMNCVFNISGGQISYNNHQANYGGGGGIYFSTSTTNANGANSLNISGGTINNNSAFNGGGIYLYKRAACKITGGSITDNQATVYGGGIYSEKEGGTAAQAFIIDGGNITKNSAQYGGGVYLGKYSSYGSSSSPYDALKMNGGEISENNARYSGGGLYVSELAQCYVLGGVIKNNKAASKGGGIFFNAPTDINSTKLYLSNCKIINNEAGENGGGLIADTYNAIYPIAVYNTVKIYNNKLTAGTANNVALALDQYLRPNETDYIDLNLNSIIGITRPMRGAYGGGNNWIFRKGSRDSLLVKEYLKCFFADDSQNYSIKALYELGTDLEIVSNDGAVKHIHFGNTTEFTPLQDAANFPNSLGGSESVNCYYLTNNTILNKTLTIDGDVQLCLNGHSLSGAANISPLFSLNPGATLTIFAEDTSQNVADLINGNIEVGAGSTVKLIDSHSHDDVDADDADDPNVPNSEKRSHIYGGADSTGGSLNINNGVITDNMDSPLKTHQEIHDQYIGDGVTYNQVFDETLLHGLTYSPGGDQHPPHANLYYYLPEGNYYMTQDVKLDHAVEIQNTTNFCLFDHFLTAYNSIWEYDMDHVFWVPDKAVLNVYDCMCDLTIIWLPGGSVHLRNGGKLNIYGNDGGRLSFTMTDGEDGGGTIYQYDPCTQTRPDDTTRPNNITLPKGVEVTGTVPGQPEASIKNSGDSLTLTQPSGKATTITPGSSEQESQPTLLPTQSTEENLLLAIPDNTEILPENGPKIVVQAPQTAQPDPGTDLPQTTLNADGALSTANPVTITPTPSADPSTTPAPITVTPPDPTLAGPKLEIAPDGTTTAPVGTTITKNDLQLTVDTPQSGPTPASVQISPAGEVTLTPGSTVTATLPDNTPGADPSRPSKTIVIALPDDTPADNAKVQLNDGGITAPPGSTLTTRGSKTIVIALPDNGSEQDVWFDDDGKIILPEGTKVKDPATGQETTITKEQNTLDPETGDLSHTENVPTKPDKPEDPAKPTDLPPGGSVTNDDGSEVKRPDKDTVTITPPGETEPSVIIKNESDDPDSPENFEPKVDKDGNVIVTPPVSVKTDDENKPEIKIEKTKDDQPAKITPEGAAELPSGGEVTVKGEDDKPIKIEVPEDGGTVKPQPDGTISLPPGAKVTIDGQTSTVGEQGGTLNPETGTVTSNSTGGSGSGSGSGGGGGADPVQSGAEKESYVITASASFGGSINPDNQTVVQPGGAVVFTITPDPGFVISDVVVDGKSIGTPEKYEFTNVRAAHSIEAVFAASHSSHGHIGCPKDETCPIWPYTDSIPKSWYHDGVHYCIENGLTIGTGPAIYEPDIPLSRAMLAQVLYNKSGKPEVTGASEFDDVSEGDWQWYWPAVTWGGRNKVVLGYGDGNFGPDDPVTREQLCTMLWRYARGPAAAVGSNVHFSDSDQVSDWAAEAVRWASSRGIVNGYPDGSFDPKGIASRAEAAQMIMRYFK